MNVLNPKGLLLIGGTVFLALAVGGMTVFGPTSQQSMLGDFFWLGTFDNYTHLLLSIVMLLAYYFLKDRNLIKLLVGLVIIFYFLKIFR